VDFFNHCDNVVVIPLFDICIGGTKNNAPIAHSRQLSMPEPWQLNLDAY